MEIDAEGSRGKNQGDGAKERVGTKNNVQRKP